MYAMWDPAPLSDDIVQFCCFVTMITPAGIMFVWGVIFLINNNTRKPPKDPGHSHPHE